MNGVNYLSWKQVKAKVKRDRTYRVERYGLKPQVLDGLDILEGAADEVQIRSCTYLVSVEEVPPGTVQDPMELWETTTDPGTGETVPAQADNSIWNTEHLQGEPGAVPADEIAKALAEERINPEVLVIECIIAQRQKETKISNKTAADNVYQTVLDFFISSANQNLKNGMPPMGAVIWAKTLASELFDRTFGYERIRLAGIDLDQHPEWHYYKAFYDRGYGPPTHAEAADIIIETLGGNREDQAG